MLILRKCNFLKIFIILKMVILYKIYLKVFFFEIILNVMLYKRVDYNKIKIIIIIDY